MENVADADADNIDGDSDDDDDELSTRWVVGNRILGGALVPAKH